MGPEGPVSWQRQYAAAPSPAMGIGIETGAAIVIENLVPVSTPGHMALLTGPMGRD